jgi:hypothetical protein
MCEWYEFVPKESSPIKKGVSTSPGSRQVVNRSRVGKCSDHHQLIMGAGRMKNCGVCITYALQLLSVVLYTHWGAMEDLWFILKHPVAMNSVFSGTFPPLACSIINSIFPARIPFANRAYTLFVASPGLSSFLPWARANSIARRTNTCCTMATPQNIRKGTRSGRSARLEPQSDWDSFLLTAGFPKDPKGDFPLCAERVISHLCRGHIGRDCAERRSVGSPVPPTTNAPEKGQAKEEQGSWGNSSPKRTAREVSCRRITYARHSAGTGRRYKLRKPEQSEKDKYRRRRCSRIVPTAEASTTRYHRALPGKQGTKTTIGSKDP